MLLRPTSKWVWGPFDFWKMFFYWSISY